MDSKPADITRQLIESVKTSPTMKVGALATIVLAAAIIGPQGLAVGPSQSHTNTPALATGAAMEARVVLSNIPISFDIIPAASGLIREHQSYPEQQVGDLRFPQGAINVPWSNLTAAPEDGEETYSAALPSPGGSVSTPSRDGTSRLVPASFGPSATEVDRSSYTVADRSVVLFSRGTSDLTGNAEEMLDRVAASLRVNNERIQLRAFGGDMADRTHAARRLALRRALSVRNYLMEHGIDQERITVRAMGGATDGGPSDRVDIVRPNG